MSRIGVEQRRARLGVRHRLVARAATPEEAARAVVALHSSDPATVFLSAWARVDGFVTDQLEDALYERRSLVRALGMRRTLFVVPLELAPAMQSACAAAFVAGERTRLARLLEEQGIVKPGAGRRWIDRTETRTLRALAARGQASARELTKDVPELGHKLAYGQGTAWAGTMGVSTRVLFLLATEGRILRARPLGSWTSGQYRWSATETWLGAPMPPLERAEAAAELLLRWLRSFGPATGTDVRWWTGWTARLATQALSAIGAEQVELDEGAGWVAPGDAAPDEEPDPWVAFLPGLDPTVMGWKEREWYLADHGSVLFDRNGNAGPTVWANGRVVGGWAQRPDGDVVVELLERVDAATRRRIGSERERLRAWLGDVRIVPRFRSPLERRLAAG